jgi:hypothetical protein
VKLKWEKVEPERWKSGDYVVWVQARIREGMRYVREYAAQYKDERPWLCNSASFWEAKQICQEHADKRIQP